MDNPFLLNPVSNKQGEGSANPFILPSGSQGQQDATAHVQVNVGPEILPAIMNDPNARQVIEELQKQWGPSAPIFAPGDSREATWNTYQQQYNALHQAPQSKAGGGGQKVFAGEGANAVVGAVRDAGVNAANTLVDVAQAIASPLASAVGDSAGLEQAGNDIRGLINSVPKVARTGGAEDVARDIGRFALGYLGAQKLMKSGAMVSGAVGDFSVTGQEDTLLTDHGIDALVKAYPQLEGPVVDFLRSPDGDSGFEKKFKAALEGIVLGKAADGIFKLVKFAKNEAIPALVGDELASLGKASADGVDDQLVKQTATAVSPADKAATKQAVLDDVIKTFDEAVHENHNSEMFPDILKKEGDIVADDGVVEAEAKMAGEDAVKVITAPMKEQGWNKLQTLRMDDHNKGVLVEGLKRHSDQMGGWYTDIPQAIPEGVFNYRNMTSSDAVKGTLDDLTTVIHENLESITGGVESLNQTAAKAGNMLADMVGAEDYKKLLAPLAHVAGDAKQITARFIAAKEMMQSMAREVHQLASSIDNGLGGSTAQFELMRRIDILTDLTEAVKGTQTAAARITSSGRIRTSDALSADDIMKVIQESGGADNVRILARRLALTGGDASKVRNILERNWLGKAIDIHNEFWINGVLSGVKTHLINNTSAFANTILRPMERVIGGAIDLGYQRTKDWMTGTSLSSNSIVARQQIAEGLGTYNGLRMSIVDSLEAAWKAMKDETAILDPMMRSVDGFTHSISTGNGKVLGEGGNLWADNGFGGNMLNAFGQFVRLPSRFLTTEDEFWKQLNYRAYLYASATKSGVEGGLSTLKNIPSVVDGKQVMLSEMDRHIAKTFEDAFKNDASASMDEALRWAREATFTQDLKATTWGGGPTAGESLQKFANQHPALRSVILPFVRTPLNLMRNTWDHTPIIGQLRKQFWTDIQAGGERRAMALGKLSTGSMMWSGAMFLASEGTIVGGGPSDPGLNKTWRSDGKLPYSFKVDNPDGTSTYIQFAKGDPFATILGIAADAHDIMIRSDQGTRESLAVTLSTALANNISNKTYLKGLTQTLALFANGNQNRETSMQNALNMRVASYIPSYMSLYNEDVEMKEVRTVLDALKAKIPGLSSKVEATRDMFGEKQIYPEGWIGKVLNPFTVHSTTLDPVRQEIARLAASSQEKSFLPLPKKENGIDLVAYKSKEGQTAYDRLLELHGTVAPGGKTMHDRMGDLIKSDVYQNVLHDGNQLYPHSKRIELLGNIRSSYKKAAMGQLLKEFPQLAQDLRTQQINQARVSVYGPSAATPITPP